MKQGKSLVYGMHAVTAVLKRDAKMVGEIWVDVKRRDERLAELVEMAHEAGVSVKAVDKEELEKQTEGSHQGVIAWAEPAKALKDHALKDLLASLGGPAFLLILDTVQDPHNLGACMRSADAAGVHAVIAPKDKSASLGPTVRKVAVGATETLPFIQVTNLARTMRWLQEQGVWLFGAAGEAEQELYQTDLSGPMALVMGGEGKGLRRLTRENCDSLLKIPMQGSVESLNVSVATGICLFEAVRQRIVASPDK